MKLSLSKVRHDTTLTPYATPCSVRILSRATRQSVSMVMPPPPISPLSRFRGVTHVRDVNATYVLIDSRHLWLYTNR